MRTYNARLTAKVKGVCIVGSHLFSVKIYVFADITVKYVLYYGWIGENVMSTVYVPENPGKRQFAKARLVLNIRIKSMY